MSEFLKVLFYVHRNAKSRPVCRKVEQGDVIMSFNSGQNDTGLIWISNMACKFLKTFLQLEFLNTATNAKISHPERRMYIQNIWNKFPVLPTLMNFAVEWLALLHHSRNATDSILLSIFVVSLSSPHKCRAVPRATTTSSYIPPTISLFDAK